MSDFKLVSKYSPSGDQPQAIDKLVQGLSQGDREQTLLGVTGSGKSVTYDSRVFIRRGNHLQQAKIGEVIDEIFAAHPEFVQISDESEYINLMGKPALPRFETFACDPETGESSWRPVTQVSRHTADKTMTVTTSCGRSVTSTYDHNFYVARNGGLKLVHGDDLKTGDWLPLPRHLPEPSEPVTSLNLLEYIGDEYPAFITLQNHVHTKDSLVRQIVGARKSWAVAAKGERIAFGEYLTATALLERPLPVATVGSKSQRRQLPPNMALTNNLLRFIGYFIAEGHATHNCLILSTGDAEVVEDIKAACAELGLPLLKRQKAYDYQISSSFLAHLLTTWCHGSASGKQLPSFWTQLSNTQLAQLLSAYFSGDGGVDGPQVTAATISSRLASDLQYALLRFGIVARKRQKKTIYGPDRHICNSWIISISGADQLQRFKDHIGFTIKRKQTALQRIGIKGGNTNVDLIPIDGLLLKQLRLKLGLSQKDLAKACDVNRSYISMLESGVRLPSASCAQKLVDHLSDQASKQKDQQALHALKQMHVLTAFYWSPIKQITYHSTQENVYDFAVLDYETFLTGDGGLFVHNTFTMANIVQQLQRPTLVLSHNKTLAAQLYSEFKTFFPDNAVQYFVSYYDYYQPEAYIPRSDTYIEKDSSINEEIDRLRHAATMSLLTRRDVLIVASVSCIYGLGNVSDYTAMTIDLAVGETRKRDKLLRQLNDIQYQRNDIDFTRGKFRVRGDTMEIWPVGEEAAYRLEFFGDELERIRGIDPLTGEVTSEPKELKIFPAKHYVTPQEKMRTAVEKISTELDERVAHLEADHKLLEAQRLKQRTKFDLEMLSETGFVSGIENYSRYLSDREPGEQPATLLDYFPDDYLMFVDESHISIPQVRGMYNGDRARKTTLVDYGFRLPSALDNRPLKFPEFEHHLNQVVYVSATPAEFELSRSSQVVQQIIRPTGLVDPQIDVRPIKGQIDDLVAEIRATIARKQRILVTTLTKRMAEDLTEYLQEAGIKVQYLHSEVQTLERVDILQDLRAGIYDVVVGINLLREGLDLPEVSLVAILDADKEGFLRGEAALIQTIGRAARHVEGRVIMYADTITRSMKAAIDTTQERRAIQEAYNKEHGITPAGIKKALAERMHQAEEAETADVRPIEAADIPVEDRARLVAELTQQMEMAAQNLQFEKAAALRDQITALGPLKIKKPAKPGKGR